MVVPRPLPDGQWVTFYSAQKPESLYIARADGTSQRQLTDDAAIDRVPRWSPDGDRIAFFSNRSGPYAVWTIHADGSGLQEVWGSGEGAVYPTWSHDGSRMAISNEGAVSLPSLAKTLIFDPNRPSREQAPEVLPPFPSTVGAFVPNSWSPDGQKLAGQISLKPQGIAIYSLRSRTFDLLTDFGEFPVWLPDSRRLLFVAGGRDFFVLDTETRQSRKMYTATRGVLGPPRLTRDGRSAYFTRRMTESDIWLVKIE
jgi:Tol biopolymer transport system component